MKTEERNKLFEENKYLIDCCICKFSFSVDSCNFSRDDAKQEGVIGLLKGIDSYNSNKGALKSYLYKKIRWSILDCIQKLNVIGKTSRFNGEVCIQYLNKEISFYLFSDDLNPREEVYRKEEFEYLLKLLSRLTKRKKEIIDLYCEGKRVKDIAKDFGVTPSRIWQLIWQFKVNVKKEFESLRAN